MLPLRSTTVIFILALHCCLADYYYGERAKAEEDYNHHPPGWVPKDRPLEEICFGWKRPAKEWVPAGTVRPGCCKFNDKARKIWDRYCKRRGWIPPKGLVVEEPHYAEDYYYYD